MKQLIKMTTLLLALCLASTIATASSIDKGRKIAKELCSKCHSIDKKSQSTNKAAPPFRIFSEKWPLESLEEALAEGIVVGHNDMPVFKFNPEQITDFLAFLSSLKNKEVSEEK